MVLNDYFDFRSGADTVNAPQKVCDVTRCLSTFACTASQCHVVMICQMFDMQPLPRGLVTPDGALLFGFVLYMGVLLAACCMVRTAITLLV